MRKNYVNNIKRAVGIKSKKHKYGPKTFGDKNKTSGGETVLLNLNKTIGKYTDSLVLYM